MSNKFLSGVQIYLSLLNFYRLNFYRLQVTQFQVPTSAQTCAETLWPNGNGGLSHLSAGKGGRKSSLQLNKADLPNP